MRECWLQGSMISEKLERGIILRRRVLKQSIKEQCQLDYGGTIIFTALATDRETICQSLTELTFRVIHSRSSECLKEIQYLKNNKPTKKS